MLEQEFSRFGGICIIFGSGTLLSSLAAFPLQGERVQGSAERGVREVCSVGVAVAERV